MTGTEDSLAEGRRRIAEAKSIMVLSGAGVSAESGVPTFRSGPDALWENHRPEDLARMDAFRQDPELVWRWYLWRRGIIAKAEPNAAHLALRYLAEQKTVTLVTQNVDGLHHRAGSEGVIELHGNIWNARCTGCSRVRNDFRARLDQHPDNCSHCHLPVRPDIVWFGEALNTAMLDRVFRVACIADVFLVVGTSGVVQPAASLAAIAGENGAFVIEVNPEETPLSSVADLVLRGPAGEILPMLMAPVPAY